MKRFDTDIGSFDRPFQEGPEVLQTVRVDRSVHVGFSMVDYFVSVLIKSVVGLQCVGIEFCSRCNVLANLVMKVMLSPTANNRCTNLPSLTIQQPEHDSLTVRPAS